MVFGTEDLLASNGDSNDVGSVNRARLSRNAGRETKEDLKCGPPKVTCQGKLRRLGQVEVGINFYSAQLNVQNWTGGDGCTST